jgi:hypothetical protein
MAVGKYFGLALLAGTALFGVALYATPMSAQQQAAAPPQSSDGSFL